MLNGNNSIIKQAGKTILYDGSSSDISSLTFNQTSNVPCKDYTSQIITVTFQDEVVPCSTRCWFGRCTNLNTINNIENLNTSCVNNMASMFQQCDSLKKIYVSNSFVTSSVGLSNGTFENCYLLTGNDDTSYNETIFDASMAKIDTAVYDSGNNLVMCIIVGITFSYIL